MCIVSSPLSVGGEKGGQICVEILKRGDQKKKSKNVEGLGLRISTQACTMMCKLILFQGQTKNRKECF